MVDYHSFPRVAGGSGLGFLHVLRQNGNNDILTRNLCNILSKAVTHARHAEVFFFPAVSWALNGFHNFVHNSFTNFLKFGKFCQFFSNFTTFFKSSIFWFASLNFLFQSLFRLISSFIDCSKSLALSLNCKFSFSKFF